MLQRDNLSFTGLLSRFLIALLLVYGTWNPEGVSYYQWAIAPMFGGPPTAGLLPLKFLVGIVLLGAWGVFLHATRRSLGVAGAVMAIAVTFGVIWLLVDLNVVHLASGRAIAHVALIALAILLCAGMSWSFVSRRMTGQVDTDITQ
jgi:hypothetical protein